MKKTALLSLSGFCMMALMLCGQSEDKETAQKTVKEKKAETQRKTEKKLTIYTGESKKTYKDVSVNFEIIPGQEESPGQVTIAAFDEESDATLKESVISLRFKGLKKGEMNNPELDMDGYSVEEVSGTVKSIKTGTHTYTKRTTIESIAGIIQAKVTKKGAAQDEPIILKGNFDL